MKIDQKNFVVRQLSKPAHLAVASATVLACCTFVGIYGYKNFRLGQAEVLMGRGFHALAAENLDGLRNGLTGTDRGCKALVNAYFGARNTVRLEWASEACIENGIQPPDVIVGLANAWEQTGKVEAAVQLLQGASEKFKEAPDFEHRLGVIYNGQKKTDLAIKSFMEAHRRAPTLTKLALDYLVFFAQNNRWTEASIVADSLKDAQTEDPEVKLLIARAFQQTGRAEASRAQVEVAKTLLDKAPNKKDALLKNFADLFQVTAPPAAPARPATKRNLANEKSAPAPNSPPPR